MAERILHTDEVAGSKPAPPSTLPVAPDGRRWLDAADASTLGPWKVATAAYAYALLTAADGNEIFGYHWHPRGRSPIATPHFHFGSGAGVERADVASAHFPSGRIALEEFLRCIIRDFQVMPRRGDWQEVLDSTQQAFETYRTWP